MKPATAIASAIFTVTGALLCAVSLHALAAEPGLGQREFSARCAMCHGTSARGDGWMAENLIRRPPSLRNLKKNNGGMFPREQLARTIDGRIAIKAHGPSEMPAWGTIYKSDIATAAGGPRGVREEDEVNISYRIQALIEYLTTQQD